jgi:hypothetical protein
VLKVFFFGTGIIGIVIAIPMFILFMNPRWTARMRVAIQPEWAGGGLRAGIG